MSEFISWIEKEKEGKKQIFFLTGKQVFHTKKGKELFKELHGDFIGHSAIRFYYALKDTTNRGRLYEKECTDFSTPNKFPAVIVRAIKRGDMRGLATPEGLLTATAEKAYQEAKAPAEKAYQEAKATAEKAYQKATTPAFWTLFAIPENRVEAWR